MSAGKKGMGVVLGAMLVMFQLVAVAQALDTTSVAFIQTSAKPTSIPVGHSEFCKARPAECQSNPNMVGAEPLTEALWGQLQAINTYFNQTIVAVTDDDLYQVAEYWTFPNGYGDCEDYALAKRRALIDAGWPASTLLMSVVKQADGEGHAVLLVRTDRGDLVLDNQVGTIDVWNQTPYKFIKRQSQANAGQWVDMIDGRDIQIITAAIK